jgi:hypothetical protein
MLGNSQIAAQLAAFSRHEVRFNQMCSIMKMTLSNSKTKRDTQMKFYNAMAVLTYECKILIKKRGGGQKQKLTF